MLRRFIVVAQPVGRLLLRARVYREIVGLRGVLRVGEEQELPLGRR